ncbi:hypothetical protein AB205_0126560, partial [Aquarana catesbeiana]
CFVLVVKKWCVWERVCFSTQANVECIAPLFQTVQETPQPIPAKIRGAVPKWIQGSLLRNGPGRFEFGNDKYNHWFDGMALMHNFHIENGSVTYMSKFLESDAYIKNKTENRIVCSEFGTLAAPDPCMSVYDRMKSRFDFKKVSTDNCSVNYVIYKGDYYVSTETNFIRKVDPASLKTLDKVDWSKFIAVNGATAHPHYDPDGTVYNMGNSYGKEGTRYNIIRVPPQKSSSGETLEGAQVICSINPEEKMKPAYYHSFGMSENYVVFVEQPLRLNIMKLLINQIRGKSFAGIMSWEPKLNTVFHVINKHTGKVNCFPLISIHNGLLYNCRIHGLQDKKKGFAIFNILIRPLSQGHCQFRYVENVSVVIHCFFCPLTKHKICKLSKKSDFNTKTRLQILIKRALSMSVLAVWDSPPDWLRHSGAIGSHGCQSANQKREGAGPGWGSVSEWTHGAVTRLGLPHSKLLAVGALDWKEGPGALKRDSRRGGFRLLCKTNCIEQKHPVNFHTKAFSTFHQINAFEDQGCIVLDLCCQDNGEAVGLFELQNLRKSGEALNEVYKSVAKAYPRRFVIPLDTSAKGDLTQPLNYSTATAEKKADGKVWKEDGFYPSEPIFVPSPDSVEEDDGVLLSAVLTPHQDKSTFLLILNAKDFTEIARAEVPLQIPYGFHGIFVPQTN